MPNDEGLKGGENMAKNNYKPKRRMPLWLKIVLGIIGVAALFCIVVLIYGSCVGQNFVEVLKDWFSFMLPKEDSADKVEALLSTAIFKR